MAFGPRVEIVGWDARFADDFLRLNLAWLDAHGLTEPPDLEHLQNPQSHIIERGGEILCACAGDELVGTAAVLPEAPPRWELAKMTIAKPWRGRGLGRALLQAAISTAREKGAAVLYLDTNSRLQPAIALYEAAGFRPASRPTPSRYATADVYLELVL